MQKREGWEEGQSGSRQTCLKASTMVQEIDEEGWFRSLAMEMDRFESCFRGEIMASNCT